jgi:maltooligosyltrehalose trehalohydrolase
MIQDLSPRHFLEELSETVHATFKPQGESSSPGGFPRYLIAEYLLNDPKVIRPRHLHGHGMDAQWCNDFHHALHVLLTGERQGYYADFGQVEHLARAYRQGYHFTGQYSQYRRRRHGREPLHTRADQFVVYAQNHDQVGNRQCGDRLTRLVPFDALKLAAAATLLAPNLPLLFMGEEYGEPAPFPFFISHGDPDLIDAVRAGRRREFAEFDWHGTVPDPQAEATFRSAVLHWELRDDGAHRALLDWYRALLRLRKTHPALARLSGEHLEATALEAERVLVLRRWDGDAQAAHVLHFSDAPADVTIPLPAGRWRRVLDSAGDVSADEMVSAGTAPLRLGPWQAVVLSNP